ncbi:hypothetical protein COCMIDRAFT_101200 [Bipolaris oryzae ATCC 44560]|uniref:Uncharacterized protein n=1 Tax=Bipolaris oryzae ATCC 44560 TaxID=930090 RepID=W6Z0V3_COCMI|nr:uncharacterized protein COCMIDRAFT_101200 [Bipolaris oryzae ATCC 44560]EUC43313.1 hypothetical protein COCMIDRAFT_101200 [Bipolaris oryzae ATCC 44560]
MPRNGDGSSDNGPIEGHEILHGTTGDDSLQHTKHVAPMPEGEKGDTLPGLSGGGTATQTSTSDSKKRSEPHHDPPSPISHIQQKHSKLDIDEAGIAGATSQAEAAHAREQRVKDAVGTEDVGSGAGGHADVEMLHGKARLNEGEQGEKSEGGQSGGACDAELLQRKKAEKFGGVNLHDDEEADGGKNGTSSTTNGGSVRHEVSGAANGGGVRHEESGANGGPGQDGESGAHNGGHVDSEAHSKGNGHASEGKKKDHGLDLANDADLLQRKKAEKFGGVNLGDD